MRLRAKLQPSKCIEFLTSTGVTHTDIARTLGVALLTVQKWSRDEADISYSNIQKLWDMVDAHARRTYELVWSVMEREGKA